MTLTKLLVTVTLMLSPVALGAQSLNLRLMSFNTRNCLGMDSVLNYDRSAAIINNASPDVVALQELDSMTTRYPGHYALGELAQRTGMHGTYARSIKYRGGAYGIGILSKQAPLSVRRYPMPGREEARVMLLVEFHDYYFACVHLSLTEQDSQASVAKIRQILSHLSKPVFIAGDMNSHPDSGTITDFSKFCTVLSNTNLNTFPADKPSECIDYVLGHGCEMTAGKTVVVKDKVTSDHRPLYVDVKF